MLEHPNDFSVACADCKTAFHKFLVIAYLPTVNQFYENS